jgi:4-hydroxy-tetrahydrodipicolinate synthase
MGKTAFKGTGVALITPFKKDKNIDFNALNTIIESQINNNIDFLVALGTTSEAATLTTEEKHTVVDFIIEKNNNRVPVVVGCGGNNTIDVVNTIKNFTKTGVDGILSVVPYYNKPNQHGIFEHFRAIAESTDLPIILYNVPGRTSSNINAETVIKLAKMFDNIVAIKEASGNFSQIMQIVKNKPKEFIILSGDDGTTLPLISLGFDGVISVVANAYPAQFSQMVSLALTGKYNEARAIHYKLIDIINAMFEDGNPAGVKAFLHINGVIENSLRLPLVSVNDNLFEKIRTLAKY